MTFDTFCRWLPDTEVVEAFVHDFLFASRALHGRYPDAPEETVRPGQGIDVANDSVGFSLLCSYCPAIRKNFLEEGELKDIPPTPLDPVVKEFKEFIEKDGEIFAGFNTMFDQAPKPAKDETRKVNILSVFLQVLILCLD